MNRAAVAAFVLAVAVAGGALAVDAGLVAEGTDRATVRLVDDDGTDLATVSVAVADSDYERYVGLSETGSLAPGEGMLFVYGEEAPRTFVMRNMSFPLDMVFVGADGEVVTIHRAPVPEETPDEDLRGYSGRAQFVLEVPRGYTAEVGLDVGDRVVVPERYRN
jgi:uncharacterized membrane protein (UPF0127 family)